MRRRTAPSAADAGSIKAAAEGALALVSAEAGRHPEVTGVEFGGSYAKGTWLAGDADVDIFVRFKESVPARRFEELARSIGFGSMRGHSPSVRYSEHPYVEARMGGTGINVVPFYDVRPGNWKSSADRSTLHSRFMRENLDAGMRGEVRVLKAFLKANGVYGAEIATGGFSGYVAEVLVFNCGSFEGVAREFAGIGEGGVIGRTSKSFGTPVVIVDPVDGNRNLAAAISDQSLGRFILASRAFLKRPGAGFFERSAPRPHAKYWKNLLSVGFGLEERSPDMAWGQIKRATATLAAQMELGGFSVLRSRAHAGGGRATLLFLMGSCEIPRVRVREGPDFFRPEHGAKFIAKNIASGEPMWIGRDRRIVALERRRHTRPEGFMRELLRDPGSGIPAGLRDDVGRGFEVSMGAGRLGRPAREAARELISTDGAILYFG